MTITSGLIGLDALPSLLAACFVLMFGTMLCQRIPFLARYSIPGPIVGGILFAAAAAILQRTSGIGISLATTVKSDMLLLFFACLGLTSDLRQLLRGGPRLLRFVAALIPFLLVQDALGVSLAWLLGLHPFLGLVAGSITLVGGHGTGAAYAEKFGAASAIPGIMALTMTSATLGLVLGGMIGGPVAERLIGRFKLQSQPADAEHGGVIMGPTEAPVTTTSLVVTLTVALLAVVGGQYVGSLLAEPGAWVHVVELCGDDERIHRRGTLPTTVAAREQPGFPADGNAAQRTLSGIVGQANPAIGQEPAEIAPTPQHVVHGLGDISVARQLGPGRTHPNLELFDQGRHIRLALCQALLGGQAIDGAFDGEDCVDPLHGFGCQRGARKFCQFEQLAPPVRPTPCVRDRAGLAPGIVKIIEPGIGVSLKNACVARQMPVGMVAAAIGRIIE